MLTKLAHAPSLDERFQSGLFGLWDIVKVLAQQYLDLGEKIAEARFIFDMAESHDADESERQLTAPESEELRQTLRALRTVCGEIPLPVSHDLLRRRVSDLPRTSRELDIIVDAVKSEMQSILFLRVPSARSTYYDHNGILSPAARSAFPNAFSELLQAGNAYALKLHTASVFHSMRAAEIGVRALSKTVGVKFKYPLELADWQNQLDQIESVIKSKGKQPKSKKKDEDLKFYSEAGAHFRYFKDAWRVRASHAREDFEQEKALSILSHTTEFFEGLSARLSEPKAAKAS